MNAMYLITSRKFKVEIYGNTIMSHASGSPTTGIFVSNADSVVLSENKMVKSAGKENP